MPKKKIHIIGAGLSGLSAAVSAIGKGFDVHIYEATGQAGGRCRSFKDDLLDTEIDNGNHLLLGANKAALGFIDEIDAKDNFNFLQNPQIPFFSLNTDEQWQLDTSNIFSCISSIPNVGFNEYIKSLRLMLTNQQATIEECLNACDNLLGNFWKPMSVSLLNTPKEKASAYMLRHILGIIAMQGNDGLNTYLPKKTWSSAIINPAVSYIENHGGELSFHERIRDIEVKDDRITSLTLEGSKVAVKKGDYVIFAVTSSALKKLIPEIEVPEETNSIINVYFRYPYETKIPFAGVVGGMVDWMFFKDGLISTTTSAANEIAGEKEEILAKRAWEDIKKATKITSSHVPLYKVIKEKRATFSCTPESLNKRTKPLTKIKNMVIAGDFTDTGLPGTMEGAIKSGVKAAKLCS